MVSSSLPSGDVYLLWKGCNQNNELKGAIKVCRAEWEFSVLSMNDTFHLEVLILIYCDYKMLIIATKHI